MLVPVFTVQCTLGVAGAPDIAFLPAYLACSVRAWLCIRSYATGLYCTISKCGMDGAHTSNMYYIAGVEPLSQTICPSFLNVSQRGLPRMSERWAYGHKVARA